ncbi:MAG: AMP-binding protein [Acidimicrobiaceae bacterium]|nr:AMP-binding protein [Acidimicrobiaceae bacterium]MCY3643069.1 AMP-binding protein [Acidimicrobiaceae bacterium]
MNRGRQIVTGIEYKDLWSLCVARVQEHPDQVVLDFDGNLWTWAELVEAAEGLAGGLAATGVAAGNVVCHMSPNHPEAVVTMLALLRLGAVECPVNAGLRGEQLAHVLNHSGARMLILDRSLADRVAEQLPAAPDVTTVVQRGPGLTAGPIAAARTVPADVAVLDYEELRGSGEKPPPFKPPEPGDPMNIIYTSGTTGPAKGAVLPQAFPIEQARIKIEQWGLTDEDVMFSALPLYHVNARFSTLGTALVVDGRAALVSRFSASTFWDQVRAAGATEVGVVGAVSSILLRQEPGPADRDHAVRMMHGAAGIPMDRRADFEERFGLRLVTGFAMTETGHFSTTSPDDPMRYRASGRPVPQYEVAVVDANDNEVPAGTVGELVVRPRVPGVMMTGYHRQTEATEAAFRNSWFHTGDLATIEDDGYIRWVDRAADAIRRRGEMISSTEVERAVCQFDAVAECAAVGVPSELGEEEVKLVVTAEPGRVVEPVELVRHCEVTLPDFCRPRYLEILDELPKTATHKVNKHQLRHTDGPTVLDLSGFG